MYSRMRHLSQMKLLLNYAYSTNSLEFRTYDIFEKEKKSIIVQPIQKIVKYYPISEFVDTC